MKVHNICLILHNEILGQIPGEKNSTNWQKQHNNGLKRNVTLTEILLSLTSGVFNF